MELVGLFSTAFIVGFSGAMMPGPLLTVTISESVKRGFIIGPLIILGHAMLEITLILLLLLGLDKFLNNVIVTGSIGIIGGVFLVWMGYGMLREVYQGKILLDNTMEEKTSSKFGPIKAGIFISLANPYWTLWWATVGLSFIVQSLKVGYIGVGTFFSGHILADLSWYCVIALAVSKGKKLMSQRVYGRIISLCGLFLIGLGIYFLYSGVKLMMSL